MKKIMKTQQLKKPLINKDLDEKEWELIRLIRDKYRFGKIVVVVHDGLPQRIEETVRYDVL